MKRLIKKNNLLLYHGTGIETAINILENMTLQGGYTYAKQRIPMYSLTDDIECAEGFGPIIFCFNNIPDLIKVNYTKEWLNEHKDIAQYIFSGDYDPKHIIGFQGEQEYIGKGLLNISLNQLNSIILSDTLNEEEIDSIIEKIQSINSEINIKEGTY